jgi:GR25 family glycosyltransferase involved in LPS biosynthesis
MNINVINLDRTPERLAAFCSINAHLPRVVRFPAIDGQNVAPDDLRRGGMLDGSVDYTPGAFGCALSHLALWDMASNETAW